MGSIKSSYEEDVMDQLIREIYEGILNGENKVVPEKVESALRTGLPPTDILDGMISAMAEVGRRFEMGEYFVPEMLIAARSMQAGMEILKPSLAQANIKSLGRVAIGTVKGDLHDIGKNLVAMMLEGAGFEIKDLGTDVDPGKFVQAVKMDGINIVALSALLTTTMPMMKSVVEALEAAGLRAKVKVMIGGAPVTETYAKQIGADGYASDASRAVGMARSLVGVGTPPG
jgi:5-methyltetrahydrofolate--homocysteine methyltransferase